jgi:hypothetical protein
MFLFALLIVFAAVTGLVARRIYVDQTPARGFASFYVGGRAVTVDRAMIRNPDLRDGGAVNRLDLALSWPDFRAAGGSAALGKDVVFIAIEDAAPAMKSKDDIDPSLRPIELYAKFLEPDAHEAPAGLIMRRFRKGTPYEGEELYVSTPDESVFSARCPTSVAVGAASTENCLWQTRTNGLDVHTRFQPRALENWQGLVAGVQAVIPRLAAPAK